MITLGSLFDGIGGFPLCAVLSGATPIWAAEVDAACVALTKQRFPGMRHYGNVSKINGADLPPVDIITFCSPCQDLSVANSKRAGIKNTSKGDGETTRSGLFVEAIRIIYEMREATHGKYGKLYDGWETMINKGFQECMRVLKPNGTLIFKWSETDIPLKKILQIIGRQPLYGHKSGKRMQTHWLCFMKESFYEE